jgi:hypothetical protein
MNTRLTLALIRARSAFLRFPRERNPAVWADCQEAAAKIQRQLDRMADLEARGVEPMPKIVEGEK